MSARANGYAVIVDPDARHALESDTVTCSHCQRIVALHDKGRRLESVVVHCHQCDKYICVPCAESARCEPFEKKLEELEGRSRLFAAAGG